jgi:hypothetical protein
MSVYPPVQGGIRETKQRLEYKPSVMAPPWTVWFGNLETENYFPVVEELSHHYNLVGLCSSRDSLHRTVAAFKLYNSVSISLISVHEPWNNMPTLASRAAAWRWGTDQWTTKVLLNRNVWSGAFGAWLGTGVIGTIPQFVLVVYG